MTQSYAVARPSYIAEAFLVQYNLILLGGALLFSLASASPIPLGCGLVLEAIYLLVAPNLAAFRRYVDAHYDQGVAAPPTVYASRVAGFERGLREVRARLRASQPPALDRLNAAVPRFAKLCEVEHSLKRSLEDTSEADLEAEIERLRIECELETEAMQKVSLRLAQNTLKRRLAQRQELVQQQHAATVTLERLEQTIHYLRSQNVGEQELAQRLDAIATDLSAPQL